MIEATFNAFPLNRRLSLETSFCVAKSSAVTDDRKSPTCADAFPSKLHKVLSDIDSGVCDSLASQSKSPSVMWIPHGRAFIVRNADHFMRVVAPKYFNQTQFRSFTRQLNLWGFTRILKGPDKGAWYHANFLRGRPEELPKIVRTKIKGYKSTKKLRLRGVEEPDFYKLPHSVLDSFVETSSTAYVSDFEDEIDVGPSLSYKSNPATPSAELTDLLHGPEFWNVEAERLRLDQIRSINCWITRATPDDVNSTATRKTFDSDTLVQDGISSCLHEGDDFEPFVNGDDGDLGKYEFAQFIHSVFQSR